MFGRERLGFAEIFRPPKIPSDTRSSLPRTASLRAWSSLNRSLPAHAGAAPWR